MKSKISIAAWLVIPVIIALLAILFVATRTP